MQWSVGSRAPWLTLQRLGRPPVAVVPFPFAPVNQVPQLPCNTAPACGTCAWQGMVRKRAVAKLLGGLGGKGGSAA